MAKSLQNSKVPKPNDVWSKTDEICQELMADMQKCNLKLSTLAETIMLAKQQEPIVCHDVAVATEDERTVEPVSEPVEQVDEAKSSESADFFNYWKTHEQYPAPDLGEYPIGSKGTCVVCDSEPDSDLLIYIMDPKNPLVSTILLQKQAWSNLKQVKVEEVRSGDLIGIEIDEDTLVRGIVEKQGAAIQVFQIDLGEYITDLEDMKRFFKLPEKMMKIPALAMLAKVVIDDETAKAGLTIEKYAKYHYEIVNIKNDILYVKFAKHVPKPKPKKLELTKEEREMLYEEPFTTSNPMVAVMGYDPKDDARLCKYYDPKTGGCFKGARCNFIHKPKDEDGWTKDRQPAVVTNPNQMKVPAIGQKLTITPCHVVASNTFYAHIFIDDKEKRKESTDLYQLQSLLNSQDYIKQYRKYGNNIYPCEGELILAKYSGDGLFYRARIHRDASSLQSYMVFFVDYGNIEAVHINDMYKWEKEFNVLPFQAIRFTIANIKPVPELNENTGIEALQKALSGQRVFAEVIDNKSGLYVTINNGEMDIGDYMVLTRKALSREPYAIADDQLIPA